MDAGALKERITVERERFTASGAWAPLATVPAARSDLSSKERAAYGATEATLVSRFTIRAGGPAASVTPADRLDHDGRIWNITGVREHYGRRRFLEITATVEL